MKKKTIFFTMCLLLLLSKSLLTKAGSASSEIKSARISFQVSAPFPYDSIGVTFWQDYFSGSQMFPPNVSIGWSNKSTLSVHTFTIPSIEKPGYFRVRIYGDKKDEYTFLIEPGDDLTITFRMGSLLFTGGGSPKLKVTYEIDRLTKNYRDELHKKSAILNKRRTGQQTFWDSLKEHLEEPSDSMLQVKLTYLETFRDHISPIAHSILQANIVGRDYWDRYYTFERDYSLGIIVDSTQKVVYETLYRKLVSRLSDFKFSDDVEILSNWYIKYLRSRTRLEQKIKYGKFEFREKLALPHILSNFQGEIRDKYLTDFILEGYSPGESYDSLFRESLLIVETPYCLEILNRLKTNLALNETAFPFELKDPSGSVVKLDDFKGKTVFLDFWYTGCGWCVKYYANTLHEVEQHFKSSNDIVFISVCIDVNKSQWLKSIEGGKYTGKDVVNLYTGGLGSNHALIRHYNIVGYPHQIIIDKTGKNNKLGKIQSLESSQLISLLNEVSAQHN